MSGGEATMLETMGKVFGRAFAHSASSLSAQRKPRQTSPEQRRMSQAVTVACLLTLIGSTAVALPDPESAATSTSSEDTSSSPDSSEHSDTPFTEPETSIAPPKANEVLVPQATWPLDLPDFAVEPQGVVPLPDGSIALFAALGGKGYVVTELGATQLSGPGITALKSSRVLSVVASPQFEQDATLYAHVGFGSEQSVVSMTVKDTVVSALTTVYGPLPLELDPQDSHSESAGGTDLGTSSHVGESYGALALSDQGDLFIGIPDVLTLAPVPSTSASDNETPETPKTGDNDTGAGTANTGTSSTGTSNTGTRNTEGSENESEVGTSSSSPSDPNTPEGDVTESATTETDDGQTTALADTSVAQRFESRSGKILRVDSSGNVPASNPLTKSPLWTAGHYTPVAFAWFNNTLLELEHSNQGTELNVIVGGRNYGWPDAFGNIADPENLHGYTNPAGTWTMAAGALASDSDAPATDTSYGLDTNIIEQPTLLAANSTNIFVGYGALNKVEKLVYNGTTLFAQTLTVQGFTQIDALATTADTLIVVGPTSIAFVAAP